MDIQKLKTSWYDFNIIQQGSDCDIFLIFSDLNDGYEFHKMITEKNKHPKFGGIALADKSHLLVIDYSYPGMEIAAKVVTRHTIVTYPPLLFLREKLNFRVIIGTRIGGDPRIIGTNMQFTPETVFYIDYKQLDSLQTNYLN